jgi:polyhydroxyalkanoate synthesis regulator phasin
MKKFATIAGLACIMTLGACNQTAKENKADAVEDAAENKADMIEQNADNMSANMYNQADQVREQGDNMSDAIENGSMGNMATNTANRM